MIANCKFREHLLSFYLLLGAVGNNRPYKRWSNRYKGLCQSDNRAEKEDWEDREPAKTKIKLYVAFRGGATRPARKAEIKDTRETH